MAAQAHSFVQQHWNKVTYTNNKFLKIYKKHASIAVESDFENNINVKSILSIFLFPLKIILKKITCRNNHICLHNLGRKRKLLSCVSTKFISSPFILAFRHRPHVKISFAYIRCNETCEV